MVTTSATTATWRTTHFGCRRKRQLTPARLGGELVALELVAEVLLGELADARLRDLVHEGDVVGEPPLRDLVLQERQDLLLGERLARLDAHAGEGALRPLRVRHADHGRLRDLRMAHQLVLEVDGGDPLPTRLDD